MDATALADLVRRGEVSASELLEQALADIEALNPTLNAVIHSLADRARAVVAAGPADGPFTGVPMLLKDLGQELAGEPLHEGMRYLRAVDYRAPVTTELARRFERSGLVIAAKTNTPELGGVPTTEPLAYGPTRNPWDVDRSPGGSSGGSAAAVAAGIVPIGHANDAGGSIRNPAARCGLVGLKPSRGRIPLGPLFGDMFAGLVTELAVTRSVRDTASLLDAVAGPAPGDPYHPAPGGADPYATVVERAAARAGAGGDPLTIGVWAGVPGGRNHLTPEAEAAVRHTAAELERLGHRVVDAHPDVLDSSESGRVLGDLVMAGTAWGVRRWERLGGRPAERDELEPITRMYLDRAATISGADVFERLERGQLITRSVDDWYRSGPDGGYDLLLSAIVAEPPNRIGDWQTAGEDDVADVVKRMLPSLWLGCWVNLTGQPSVAVPTHWTDDNLPLGVQLVARHGREDVALRAAAELEQAVPWSHRRPTVSVDQIRG